MHACMLVMYVRIDIRHIYLSIYPSIHPSIHPSIYRYLQIDCALGDLQHQFSDPQRHLRIRSPMMASRTKPPLINCSGTFPAVFDDNCMNISIHWHPFNVYPIVVPVLFSISMFDDMLRSKLLRTTLCLTHSRDIKLLISHAVVGEGDVLKLVRRTHRLAVCHTGRIISESYHMI